MKIAVEDSKRYNIAAMGKRLKTITQRITLPANGPLHSRPSGPQATPTPHVNPTHVPPHTIFHSPFFPK
ncbi:hypothetical protein E2C01_010283 [Portunus trituberculatus]|uniref:Uncharacterized protein n=1 Tax=Portunus trituberculatus TaxID=210409 RepID=A0A5B7D829_PORTR|nr:hypothetical protein [Portunus trituberculatus]